jgi:serine/threonine protein kinase
LHYTSNHCYLITEFCEGGTLEQWAKQGGDLPWGEVVRQVGEGCAYLAKMRVLHRDIKPANIFLKDGVWKIGDFGFERALPEGQSQVRESYRVGSPIFMPLESL